ncbi:MAG TPA: rhomboid family intramembrane serine protease [Bacteroidales bacterium]|nr:rhomboid family intramembrane serine protease [Bacteroidales bacterium]
MGLADDIKSSFRKGSSVTRLIYINASVFLLISLVSIIGYLLKNQDIPSKTLDLLSVPSSLKSLAGRPWTLFTYMFTHKDIWHILFNMLWLYWFGRIFLEYLDQRKLVSVYLLGGLCGAVVYILAFNLFPAFKDVVDVSVAIGASASVMAVVVAIAAYVPDYTVQLFLLGKVKIKYLALAIFVLTSVMDFSVNSGGKLAHIGGALFGYLYTLNLKKGHDIGRGINRIIDFFATLFKPRKKLKVTYKKPVSDYDYNKIKTEHQEKINLILDKISKGGYDSLSKDEKDTLFKESQNKN